MSSKIKTVHAHEILDSRGNPTLEVRIELTSGTVGRASVPSGASVGKYEAFELRDKDIKRYLGKGVLKACQNVNGTIAKVLKGKEYNQQKIDKLLIRLDGTENKSKLGANAILGVSLACARAAAQEKQLPLYKYITKTYKIQDTRYKMPVPMFNIINGGKHAPNNLDIQEFLVVPQEKSLKENLRIGTEIFHNLAKVLQTKNLDTRIADEGDGLSEDGWEGWGQLNSKLQITNSKLMVVADDLTATNIKRLEKAIEEKAANTIVIKPNQVGTLTETIESILLAQQNSWKVIISHRSGETCDSFISDLAAAVGADYIKAGAPSRGERVAKYNRLLEIEEEI